MYAEHATEIQAECRHSVSAFSDVLCFVLATIQEPLERVPDSMDSIRRLGIDSPMLWGMKRQGYRDITKHSARLHSKIMAAATLQAPLWRERALIELTASITGLNLAKAGFVLQLAVGHVGCLDTHNRRRFGLEKVRIRPESMKYETMLKHAAAYVRACEALGGCAFLWDSWCDYVAEQRPKNFADGDAVSAAHLCAVQPF